ncbi:MAG: DNA polymerase III subunit epsilon [archaeon]|nr:DNA polymerase III subunit epsilon [archaeon]
MTMAKDRPLKGTRLKKDYPEDYVCIDLETTGLRPSSDWTIEVAAYRVRAGKVTGKYISFVRPGELSKVSAFITKLTGITKEMVEDAPLPEQVFPELFEFVGNDVILGHNVSFDVNFMYDGAERAGLTPISNDFMDTRWISKAMVPELPNNKLGTIADHFDIEVVTAHRAAADVETTVRCFEKMVMGRDAIIE